MEKIKKNIIQIIAAFVLLQAAYILYLVFAAFFGFYKLNALFYIKNFSSGVYIVAYIVIALAIIKKKSWVVIPYWAVIIIPLVIPLIKIPSQSMTWLIGMNIAAAAYLSFKEYGK